MCVIVHLDLVSFGAFSCVFFLSFFIFLFCFVFLCLVFLSKSMVSSEINFEFSYFSVCCSPQEVDKRFCHRKSTNTDTNYHPSFSFFLFFKFYSFFRFFFCIDRMITFTSVVKILHTSQTGCLAVLTNDSNDNNTMWIIGSRYFYIFLITWTMAYYYMYTKCTRY